MESESSGASEVKATTSQPPELAVARLGNIASPVSTVLGTQMGTTRLKQMDAMLPQRKLTLVPAQSRPLLSSNTLPVGTKAVFVRAALPVPGSPSTLPKPLPGARLILIQPKAQNGVRPTANLIKTLTSTTLSPKSFYPPQRAPAAAIPASIPSIPPYPSAKCRGVKAMKEMAHLSLDLQEGYMILLDILADKNNNWPFMNQVDPILDNALGYDKVITKPMWLNKIKEKFRNNEYSKMNDFVNDLRLMFENCYRYNGPAHPVTKRALKLEHLMEQKIGRLPQNLKEECAIAKFLGTEHIESESDVRRSKRLALDYYSPILYRVREDREKREAEIRFTAAQARRLQKEEHERRIKEWEEQLFSDSSKRLVKAMWEIPQIGLFLSLARHVLSIGEVSIVELELMFLMPEASLLLTTLMTNLLTAPQARINLDKNPPKDNGPWRRKLCKRLSTEFYRCYRKERMDPIRVLDVMGIEPQFWDIVGDTNPLDEKEFHELSLHQRVWIFKTLCDVALHSEKSIQEAIAEEVGPDAREVHLGVDRHNFHYFHLPAVSGDDVRVYRQKGYDLEMDPYWGPICHQREQDELERLRIEESEKQKAKEAKEAEEAKNEKATKGAKGKRKSKRETKRKTITEAKKEGKPRRYGTRVSPRTLEKSGIPLAESSDESSAEDKSKDTQPSLEVHEEPKTDENMAPSDEESVLMETEEDPPPAESDEVLDTPKLESDAEDIPRDPYKFQLIIDSIGELKEWIVSFGGEETPEPVKEEVPEGENTDKKVDKPQRKVVVKPVKCEIKLRKNLEELLAEKQCLAVQQMRIHEKITKRMWQEWDIYINGGQKSKAGEDDGEDDGDLKDSATNGYPILESVGSDNEGIGSEGEGRYPKRMLKKRKFFEPDMLPPSKHAKMAPEPVPVQEGPPRLLVEGGVATRKSAADVKRYIAALGSQPAAAQTKIIETSSPPKVVERNAPKVESSPVPVVRAAKKKNYELTFDIYGNLVQRGEDEKEENEVEERGTLSYEDDSEDEDWGVRKRREDRKLKKLKGKETEDELKQQLQALKRQQTMLSGAGQEPLTKGSTFRPSMVPPSSASTTVVKEGAVPASKGPVGSLPVDVAEKPETKSKSVSFDMNAVVQQAARSGLLPAGVVTPLQIRVDEFVLTVQVQMGLDGPKILSYSAQ